MSSENGNMPGPTPSTGYSALVRMELRIDGQRFRVAQAGGGRLIFNQPVTLPGTTGEFIMHIDDHERRWRVTLQPNGPSRIVPATFDECR